jgi:YegS/Rv2252/BmrU family lipid kinase
VNPLSGNLPDERALASATTWLQDRGWAVDRHQTECSGHAKALAAAAAASGFDVVVVCGGDGTVNEAVNGIAGTGTALAVIPAGTANVWAKEIGVRRDTLFAARCVDEGERHRVDVGSADGRYFLLLATVGTDSQAVFAVTAARKRRWGRLVYVAAGLDDLFRNGGRSMVIDADGERIATRALVAIAGNSRSYGGVMVAALHAHMDDGLLDLCVYTGRGWRELAGHAWRTIRHRHDRSAGVIYRQVRSIRIEPTHPVAVEVDGEYIGRSPMTFQIVPKALTVIVPRGLRSPLFTEPPAPE